MKGEKVLIDRLQINIGGIAYLKKLKLIYNYLKNASIVNLLNLKRHSIQPR